MKYDEKKFRSPAHYVEWLQILAQDCVSLNTPVGDSEDGTDVELGDMLPYGGPTPEESAIRECDKKILLDIIHSLDPRERIVISMRYGFETGEMMTLEEIGEKYGVTRERIRQIESKALRKLRFRLRQKNIKEGDL